MRRAEQDGNPGSPRDQLGAFYSDYICALQDGRVAKFGTVEEVMTKETLSELYQVDFKIMTIAGRPLSIYY